MAASVDDIPSEVWMTRKFDNSVLWLCNAVYEQNSKEKLTKGCILPIFKKGNLRITKKYRAIILTTIAARVYNILLLNLIQSEIEKILRKNQITFQRNCSTTSLILTIDRILEKEHTKDLEATLLFVNFPQSIWL